jgi:hypothetical protein
MPDIRPPEIYDHVENSSVSVLDLDAQLYQKTLKLAFTWFLALAPYDG